MNVVPEMAAKRSSDSRASLTRYAWLSIFAALATILLKSLAFWLTGSMGLLSDALESLVNLIGAVVAFAMLSIAARPADEEHGYGHSKAEYFASGAEGALILVAAISIGVAAVSRLLHPQALEQTGIGLLACGIASLINFGVARVLLTVGKQYESITLEADARHLMTDVWTSAGVILGVAMVAITGWNWLDPLVAIGVAVNILWTGYGLLRRSVLGLMDTALPASELAIIEAVLTKYRASGLSFHALRTRQAASRRFVSVHVLVPGKWTVQDGHEKLEQIEADIRRRWAWLKSTLTSSQSRIRPPSPISATRHPDMALSHPECPLGNVPGRHRHLPQDFRSDGVAEFCRAGYGCHQPNDLGTHTETSREFKLRGDRQPVRAQRSVVDQSRPIGGKEVHLDQRSGRQLVAAGGVDDAQCACDWAR